MEKTVVELFAGVGGFRVGLNHITDFNEEGIAIENGEWKFVWANQWEPSTKTQPAFECYSIRFGLDNEYQHSNVDISLVDKSSIPNHNLLVGGFPCQDYSVARSLSGEKGIEGKKGVLFWDIANILKEKHTPFVLLENVDRLLKSPSNQRGRDFGIMLRSFHDLGYNVEWRVINAAEYGARQKRRRTFIFAWKRNTYYQKRLNNDSYETLILKNGLFAQTFPIKNDKKQRVLSCDISSDSYEDTVRMTKDFNFRFENTGCMIEGSIKTFRTFPCEKEAIPLREILEHNVDKCFFLNETQKEKFKEMKGAKRKPRKKPNGEQYFFTEGAIPYPENLELPGRTMLTSEATINRSTHVIEDLDTHGLRFLTPIETERLQYFPDDWTNTGMTTRQRYFMMGNALVTYIIATLEPHLSTIFDKEK